MKAMMKLSIRKYLVAAIITLTALASSAINFHPWGMDFSVDAFLNIGGASPLPLPAEIRKIDEFNPNLNLGIGVQATKWIPFTRCGVAVGLRFEQKSMDTKARVKNYGMTMLSDGTELSGRWTGRVSTHYQSQQLAIPVLVVVKCNRFIDFQAGPYFAYAMRNNFNGYVSDGYLRVNDPTGDKQIFEGDAQATYDFENDLRDFQWGAQAGIAWKPLNHLRVIANLEWGLNDIFESSFKTISFNMYPIFFNVGFGYTF